MCAEMGISKLLHKPQISKDVEFPVVSRKYVLERLSGPMIDLPGAGNVCWQLASREVYETGTPSLHICIQLANIMIGSTLTNVQFS